MLAKRVQNGRCSSGHPFYFAGEAAMEKALSEMTREELWELFPISLVEHDDRWAQYYAEMESILKKRLQEYKVVRISHIGSTAIRGIWAKNIVDILVEISPVEDMKKVARTVEKSGFIPMSAGKDRISLNRGYTCGGFAEKVYHLHIRWEGDNGELYFRDYMNEYPELAGEYERLKFALWKRYERDRDAYTHAKTEFVEKWTQEARKRYKSRY